jgi:methylmalonyl-CoA mutase C-terminal domain/subunit
VADSPGHSSGYYVVAHGLRDAGIEVIRGGDRTPREIAEAALEEDIDYIGYRIMDGAPSMLVSRLREHLRALGLEDTQVVVGGIIPKSDFPLLRRLGVRGIFTPGARFKEIADFLVSYRGEKGRPESQATRPPGD